MKITKIEKKKRLYLVELDDWDKLYVTEDTLVRFMLSKGLDIPEDRLEEIKTFAQFSYGKNLALYYLSFKPRTEKEVQTYLLKYEIEETIIPQILDNLKADKWIDDRRLTQTILEQNLHSGDKGPYAIRQKLQQKGIKKNLLDELLEEVDFSPVLDRLVQKLYRKYEGKLPLKALQQKMTQFLSARGFAFQDIREAMGEIDWEKDEEEELELLERELDKQYRKYSRKYDGYQLKQRLTMALARKGYDFDDIRSALRDYL